MGSDEKQRDIIRELTYDVHATREGKWWTLRVPAIENAVSQTRRLTDVERAARALIADMLDTDASDISVTVAVTDNKIAGMMREMANTRAAVEKAQATYRDALAADAAQLAESGLPVRDIGYVLGISHQRAQQLISRS